MRFNNNSWLSLVVAVCGACSVGVPGTGYAQGSALTIVREAPFSAQVAKAFILSYAPGEAVSVLPAVSLSSATPDKILLVGRVPFTRDTHNLIFLLGGVAKTGEVTSAIHTLSSGAEDPVTQLDTVQLRKAVEERRTMLTSWDKQAREQTANLERLQEGADVIANVGRIIDAEDELGAIKGDVERLSSSLKLANERIKSLSDASVPLNFTRREAELTSELNTMSTAVKTTEATALQKVSAASADLQQKLALIEATKNEHIDLLERELASLRRERIALEKGGQ